jgi:hypothetical protein
MDAYLNITFLRTRNAHVGRLRKYVRTLSVACWRPEFDYFLLKFAVLIHRRIIIFASNDAPKVIPDEGLGDYLDEKICGL